MNSALTEPIRPCPARGEGAALSKRPQSRRTRRRGAPTIAASPTRRNALRPTSLNRLTAFTDPSGSTKLCYDRRGNVKRKLVVVNGVSQTTRWSYSTADRITQLIYPSGAQANYSRDALGRISAIAVTPAGGSLQTLISAVSYYPFGPVKQLTWGTGETMLRSYDQNYWINGIQASQTSGLALNFALDPVGNIRQIADANAVKAARNDYDYDALNRLSTVLWPIGSGESYEYDAIGNRTSKMLLPIGDGPIRIIPYDYLAGSHRLDAVGGIGRSYDANGNTLKRDRNAGSAAVFAFDERNRYSAVTAPGAETRYQYNARGERVLKNVNSLSAASRSFAYDESGRLLMEANAASSAIQEFIWLDDLPVGVIAAGLIHQIQPDHLGSPRKVIQTSNNTAIWDWPILGNAFGEAQPNPDPDGNGQAFTLNLRFPGQQYDAESGLNYNYFRDYEPGTGRYVESDPIGLDGGNTTYGYANGSPIDFSDALGMATFFNFPHDKEAEMRNALDDLISADPQPNVAGFEIASAQVSRTLDAEVGDGDQSGAVPGGLVAGEVHG